MNSRSRNFIITFFFASVISFLFLLTRSAEYISRNFIFILDQGRDYVFVRDLVLNKKITLIGSEIGGGFAGFQGIFQGPFHFYFLSVFYALFKGDPYGGLIYMGLFAVLSVITAYVLGRKVFGNFYGLILAFLVTVSPPLIAQAKFIWNPYPITFFLLLTFLFVYLSLKKQPKYLLLAGFFSAFTYNFEIATTVPLLVSLVLFYIFVAKLRKIKEYVYLFAGIIAGVLPFLLFEVRHGFNALTGFFSYMTSFGGEKDYGLINNRLDRFLYNFNDTFPHQNIFPELSLLIVFAGSVLILVMREKRAEIKKMLIFLGILISATIFIFSFLRNTIFMYYFYQLNLVYIFIFTYILYGARVQKKYILQLIFGFLLIMFAFLAYKTGVKDFKNDLSDRNAFQKIKGKTDAVNYIYNDAGNIPFGLFIFAPTVYTYPYDYLFWLNGKNYKNVPSQDKNGLFYLLIEVDRDQPWTYKGWLETVIKEGAVIEEKTLPSGLIIQKRCGSRCPLQIGI